MIDIEAVLVAWIEDNVEDVRASTETPSDLDGQLPWIQVGRIGGPYDGFRRDQPVVDITVYDTTGPDAADLALQLQELFHQQLAGSTTSGAVINRVETRSGPHWVPYDNPGMRRYEATYALVVHPA